MRKQRELFEINPDAPGVLGLIKGEGDDRLLVWLARVGLPFALVLMFVTTIVVL